MLTGRTIHISVPECGIDGDAEVVRIEPCPAIRGSQWWNRLLGRSVPPGARVVTGTFRHRGAQVLDLRVEGLDEPIGTTPNHPFWSEDRQAFVRADELVPGERLRAFRDDRRPAPLSATPEAPRGPPAPGTAEHAAFPRVVSLGPRPGTHTVYNLEVQVDHVYHVAKSGLLVHNGSVNNPFDGCAVNWKSVLQFGHTFNTHGQGPKNLRSLTGRAASVGHQQGQWLNNEKAAEFLSQLQFTGNEAVVRIPPQLGQVVLPNGRTIAAEWAKVVRRPNGGFKSAYPVDPSLPTGP